MQKNILIGLAVLVIVGGGVYLATKKPCEGASCGAGKPVTILEDTTTDSDTVPTSSESSETTPTSQPNTGATPSSSNDTAASVPSTSPAPTSPTTPTPAPAPAQPVASVGTYEAYSPDKIARAENGDVVLFFHASWCPSCRGVNANIEANLDDIPGGLTILKLDYDRETELKKKYGVTSQHTFVQVDKDGNLIKKWSGGGTLTSIVNNVK